MLIPTFSIIHDSSCYIKQIIPDNSYNRIASLISKNYKIF